MGELNMEKYLIVFGALSPTLSVEVIVGMVMLITLVRILDGKE